MLGRAKTFASPTPYPLGSPERRFLKALAPIGGGTSPDAPWFPCARRLSDGVWNSFVLIGRALSAPFVIFSAGHFGCSDRLQLCGVLSFHHIFYPPRKEVFIPAIGP
jgi:hypothetical protein